MAGLGGKGLHSLTDTQIESDKVTGMLINKD